MDTNQTTRGSFRFELIENLNAERFNSVEILLVVFFLLTAMTTNCILLAVMGNGVISAVQGKNVSNCAGNTNDQGSSEGENCW